MTALPAGQEGVAYEQTVPVSGGTPPYHWTADGLPAGLTIDDETGEISGTPTEDGVFSVELTVTDTPPEPPVAKTATVTKALTIVAGAASGPVSYDGRVGGVAGAYAPMDLVPCDVGDLRVVVAMSAVAAQTTDVAGWTRTTFTMGPETFTPSSNYSVGVWYRYKQTGDPDTVALLCIHDGVKYSYAFSNVGGGALVIEHDSYFYAQHGNNPTNNYQLVADVDLVVDSDTFLVVLGDGAQAIATPAGWDVVAGAGTSMMGNVFGQAGGHAGDTVLSPALAGAAMYDVLGIMIAVPNVGSPP